jgi:hypothetical protein
MNLLGQFSTGQKNSIQPKNFFKRFWWAWLILIVIVAGFATAAYLGAKHDKELGIVTKDGKSYGEQRDIFTTSKLFDKDAEVKFTVPPMPIDAIGAITPLGEAYSGEKVSATGAGSHNIPSDHIYVQSPGKGDSHFFDVFSVADGYLVQMDYQKKRWEDGNGNLNQLDDYGMTFQYSKNQFLMILHLTSVSPEIQSKIGELKEGDQNFFEIPVKAGQLLGKSGGSPTLGSVDLWAVDLNKKAHFIHPERYGIKSGNAVQALDYFAEPLKSQLIAKLPNRSEPRGGEFAYDIDGKLVGNWFPLSGNEKGMPTLSFFYYSMDPTIIQIGYMPTQMVYIVKGNGPDPATIDRSSGIVKYEVMNHRNTEGSSRKTTNFQSEGTFLVQMLENRKIKVELFEGKTATEVTKFDSNAIEYDR